MNGIFGLVFNGLLASVSETAASETVAAGLEFHPESFISSSVYMGKGMIAIFVTIGIIVIVTAILNRIKTKDKE